MKNSILFKLPLALTLLASYNNISQQKSNEEIYLAQDTVHMDKNTEASDYIVSSPLSEQAPILNSNLLSKN